MARRRQERLQEASGAAGSEGLNAAGGLAALLPVLMLNASPAVSLAPPKLGACEAAELYGSQSCC